MIRADDDGFVVNYSPSIVIVRFEKSYAEDE
jgi:hypothetical protein